MARYYVYTATLYLLLTGTSVFAAERGFFSKPFEHGFYLAPVVRVSSAEIQTSVFTGVKGGWIINHRLVLGAGGYGLIPYEGGDRFVGYGGVILGYLDSPHSVVHPTTQILIGAGTRDDRYIYHDGWSKKVNERRTFIVIEPQLGVDINISRTVRWEIGGSYLFAGTNEKNSNSDLNGLNGVSAIKFGRF